MTTKHSPTPWRIDVDCADGTAIVCPRKGGDIVALSPGVEGWEDSAELWPANAAHIIKCVNLHDELIAAIKGAREILRAEARCGSTAASDASIVLLGALENSGETP